MTFNEINNQREVNVPFTAFTNSGILYGEDEDKYNRDITKAVRKLARVCGPPFLYDC